MSPVGCRSYDAAAGPEGQTVSENPEWEKARQALASISKTQSATKTAQANRTTAQVCACIFVCVLLLGCVCSLTVRHVTYDNEVKFCLGRGFVSGRWQFYSSNSGVSELFWPVTHFEYI